LFLDASPSGDDVFVATHDALVPNRNAGDYMLYDARVGGGFPLSPQGCTGASCQGQAAPPPDATPPSSSALKGAGNPRQAKVRPCGKGKVRKHGKCVKKKMHKKKHARSHSHNGHSKGNK
jgi:hypothetical protein